MSRETKRGNKRERYAAPTLVPLGDLRSASGACTNGSGFSGAVCNSGGGEDTVCTTGTGAGVTCVSGGSGFGG
jgi:hypothetical protein